MNEEEFEHRKNKILKFLRCKENAKALLLCSYLRKESDDVFLEPDQLGQLKFMEFLAAYQKKDYQQAFSDWFMPEKNAWYLNRAHESSLNLAMTQTCAYLKKPVLFMIFARKVLEDHIELSKEILPVLHSILCMENMFIDGYGYEFCFFAMETAKLKKDASLGMKSFLCMAHIARTGCLQALTDCQEIWLWYETLFGDKNSEKMYEIIHSMMKQSDLVYKKTELPETRDEIRDWIEKGRVLMNWSSFSCPLLEKAIAIKDRELVKLFQEYGLPSRCMTDKKF